MKLLGNGKAFCVQKRDKKNIEFLCFYTKNYRDKVLFVTPQIGNIDFINNMFSIHVATCIFGILFLYLKMFAYLNFS